MENLLLFGKIKVNCECHQKALHNDLNASGKASALAAFFLPVTFTMVVKVGPEYGGR
jgi:hypothetical protein